MGSLRAKPKGLWPRPEDGVFRVSIKVGETLTAVFRKSKYGYIGYLEELPGANTRGGNSRRNKEESDRSDSTWKARPKVVRKDIVWLSRVFPHWSRAEIMESYRLHRDATRWRSVVALLGPLRWSPDHSWQNFLQVASTPSCLRLVRVGDCSRMSPDKNILRTLFTRKRSGGSNAWIVADEWSSYSSANAKGSPKNKFAFWFAHPSRMAALLPG